jgi:hypothetical protein
MLDEARDEICGITLGNMQYERTTKQQKYLSGIALKSCFFNLLIMKNKIINVIFLANSPSVFLYVYLTYI